MTNGKNAAIAGHVRERKTTPQYGGTLCAKYFDCQKEGHCRPRCSNGNMKCYKAPEKPTLN